MNLKIDDLDQFVNCIHDYIIEEFNIHPRDFETRLLVGATSLVWDRRTGNISDLPCSQFNGPLHVHEKYHLANSDEDDDLLICCSEVDVIALRYLQGSIFDCQKPHIIKTMHDWLPAATMHCVRATMPNKRIRVRSYFEPSYLFRFYDKICPGNMLDAREIDYTYIICSNIVYQHADHHTTQNDSNRESNQQQQKPSPPSTDSRIRIMDMGMNRYRSSSPGATSSRARRGRRRRSRSRSTAARSSSTTRRGRRNRSRSRSPAARSGGAGGRRRRRSRSRSRSRR